MKGEYDIVNNRYLRVLTASLVALVLVLGAGACVGPLAPCSIEQQFEEITEALLTPEAASPEATPGVPIATPPLPTTTPIPSTATPTLEVVSTTYTNASLGFSMWYPEEWVYEEDEVQITFATSQEIIDGDEMESGAAMLVIAQDLGDEAIEDVVQTVTSLVLSGEDIQRSDPEPRAIGGQDGTVITFEGTPEGAEVRMRGFLAAVEYEDWGYFFFGASVWAEWPEYGPDLEAMLDSVRLTARTRPEPMPTEAFTPDNWEPDDSLADANLIQVGDTQTHNLHVEGDHDWVYFEAEGGKVYVIQTSNLGDDIDTIIYLYDQDDNELASDDDSGDENLASRVRWTATEDGTFYVMTQDYDDAQAGPGTSYDISLSLGETYEPDEYEPDDSPAQGSEIGVGETQTHNLHVEGDQDWVYFVAEAGATYIIETSNLGDDIDTEIYLYDEAENELAYNDDEGDEYLASRVEWTAEEDGTFYVMVRDYDDAAAGPGAEYDLSVSKM